MRLTLLNMSKHTYITAIHYYDGIKSTTGFTVGLVNSSNSLYTCIYSQRAVNVVKTLKDEQSQRKRTNIVYLKCCKIYFK